MYCPKVTTSHEHLNQRLRDPRTLFTLSWHLSPGATTVLTSNARFDGRLRTSMGSHWTVPVLRVWFLLFDIRFAGGRHLCPCTELQLVHSSQFRQSGVLLWAFGAIKIVYFRGLMWLLRQMPVGTESLDHVLLVHGCVYVQWVSETWGWAAFPVTLGIISHSDRCVAELHCGFNLLLLMTNEMKWLFLCHLTTETSFLIWSA